MIGLFTEPLLLHLLNGHHSKCVHEHAHAHTQLKIHRWKEKSHIKYCKPIHNLNSGNPDPNTLLLRLRHLLRKSIWISLLQTTPPSLIPLGQCKGSEHTELSVTYPGTFLMTKTFIKRKLQLIKWHYETTDHKNKADWTLWGEHTALREELNMSLSEKSNTYEKGKSNHPRGTSHLIGCSATNSRAEREQESHGRGHEEGWHLKGNRPETTICSCFHPNCRNGNHL